MSQRRKPQAPPRANIESFLSLDEAAQVLGVERRMVDQLVRDGRLRVAKLSSNLVRVPASALAELARG
jgi:excisionase family DNA binding protein